MFAFTTLLNVVGNYQLFSLDFSYATTDIIFKAKESNIEMKEQQNREREVERRTGNRDMQREKRQLNRDRQRKIENSEKEKAN